MTEVLSNEANAFVDSNSDCIKTLLNQKTDLLTSIEQRAKIKARLMAESGLGIRPGKVEKLLLTIPDPELHSLWQSVNTQLLLCKEKNKVNEKIVSHSLKRVNQMMSILRGQQNTPSLYASSGRKKSLAAGQYIGEA